MVNIAFVTIATGEYNMFMESLIMSMSTFCQQKIYILTDVPEAYAHHELVETIKVPHLGWPRMPLLRFEALYHHRDKFTEDYLFLIDGECKFASFVLPEELIDMRVTTLHRNIMRLRKDFNYEANQKSKAFVAENEGEKYYSCVLSGGEREEFIRMSKTISENIRADIDLGIRAIWGDESHLNRYMIDNPPTKVLPPNYMCPENNPYFTPKIIHRNKRFKSVTIHDTKRLLDIKNLNCDVDWEI